MNSHQECHEQTKILKDVLAELKKLTSLFEHGGNNIIPRPEDHVGSGDGPGTPVPKKKTRRHDIPLSDRARALYVKTMMEKQEVDQDAKSETELKYKSKWDGLSQERQAKWKLKAGKSSTPEEIVHMRPRKKSGYQIFTAEKGKKLLADGVVAKDVFSNVGRMWSNMNDSKKKEYQELSEENFRNETTEYENILAELPEDLRESVEAEQKKVSSEKKQRPLKKKKQMDIATALNMSGVAEKTIKSSKAGSKTKAEETKVVTLKKKPKRPAENSISEPLSKKKKAQSKTDTSSSSSESDEEDIAESKKKKTSPLKKINKKHESTSSSSESEETDRPGSKTQKMSTPVKSSSSSSNKPKKVAGGSTVNKSVKEGDSSTSSDSDSDSDSEEQRSKTSTKKGGKTVVSPKKTGKSPVKSASSSSSKGKAVEVKTRKTPSKSLNTSSNPYTKQLMDSDSDSDKPMKKKTSPKKSSFTSLNKKATSSSSSSDSDSD